MLPREILAKNYQNVLSGIREAGRGKKIALIAVSKSQPADAVAALYELGQLDFGENYAQELLDKAHELEKRGLSGIRWHFIGHLQTNKVKGIVEKIHAIHSVDSEKLAREISRRRGSRTDPLPVFIEVNIDGQTSKAGVRPKDVLGLARTIQTLPDLALQGLMCVPDPTRGNPALSFALLKDLEESCHEFGSQGMLSMGMSGDYIEAINAGATHVRVGTSIFGSRPTL